MICDHFTEYFWAEASNRPLSCYMYGYGILITALIAFGLRVKHGEEAIANGEAVAVERKKLDEDMKEIETQQKVRHIC